MAQRFYQPADGVAGDFIPFYEDGWFYLFYLKDYRDIPGHGEGTPWFLIRTRDFTVFEELGEVVPRGTAQQQDLFIFTGSVLRGPDGYHLYYTGYNPHFPAQGKAQEAIMHATAQDLTHWVKQPADTFFADPARFEPHDFRDPFVYHNPERGRYEMLLVSRAKGAGPRGGFTARYVSEDLARWREDGALYAPGRYHTHECPDLFRIGDWWYLVFSEYSDRNLTRYVMARGPEGPWTQPADDAFDGRAFYAAKTASDGRHRYLFGWVPTREGDCDTGAWQWGGSLNVHQLVQRPDGTLGCTLPESLAHWPLRRRGDARQVLPEVADDAYRLTLEVSGAQNWALALGAYRLERADGQLRWSGPGDLSGLCRPLGHRDRLRLDLTRQGDTLAVYAGDVALSARLYGDLAGVSLLGADGACALYAPER